MKNEEIKRLFDSRFALCMEHGEAIAVLQAGQQTIIDGLNTLTVRQSDVIDKLIQTEKDVIEIKAQRKATVGIISGVASLCAMILGAFLDYLFRRQ